MAIPSLHFADVNGRPDGKSARFYLMAASPKLLLSVCITTRFA